HALQRGVLSQLDVVAYGDETLEPRQADEAVGSINLQIDAHRLEGAQPVEARELRQRHEGIGRDLLVAKAQILADGLEQLEPRERAEIEVAADAEIAAHVHEAVQLREIDR